MMQSISYSTGQTFTTMLKATIRITHWVISPKGKNIVLDTREHVRCIYIKPTCILLLLFLTQITIMPNSHLQSTCTYTCFSSKYIYIILTSKFIFCTKYSIPINASCCVRYSLIKSSMIVTYVYMSVLLYYIKILV